MDKKSFFLGVLAGVVLTFALLFVIEHVNQKPEAEETEVEKTVEEDTASKDPIDYLEQPVSYENKTETSFQVFQVLGRAALATEASDIIGGDVIFHGTTVLILGENFYTDQVVTVKNPQRIGSYSYTNKNGIPMTVPVIVGDMK